MKQLNYLTSAIFLIVLTSCSSEKESTDDNKYFICDGYISEDYLEKTTSMFTDTESLVVNQKNKTLTFNFMDSTYEEPRPNYIFSQKTLEEISGKSTHTHLLKFDIVTGELLWTIGKKENVSEGYEGSIPIEKEYRYTCRKVDKLI